MLSGGGARAAYQVGFLRVLTREFPEVVPGVVTGVSAGGINAAYLAARQEPFGRKVDALADIWRALRMDNVFRVDLRDLAGFRRGDREAVAAIDVQHHRDVRLPVAHIDDLIARHGVACPDFLDRCDFAEAGRDALQGIDLAAV